ncbi:MAG: antitoxin VbhA family protein [Dermatophilaceae bacterium]
MTGDARVGQTSSAEAERARWVEDAVHSVRMESMDLPPEDAADAGEYVAGRITSEEYGRRTRAATACPRASPPVDAA